MRHVCSFKKKKKLALLPSKYNAALNDDNHLQGNKKEMREKWQGDVEKYKKSKMDILTIFLVILALSDPLTLLLKPQ